MTALAAAAAAIAPALLPAVRRRAPPAAAAACATTAGCWSNSSKVTHVGKFDIGGTQEAAVASCCAACAANASAGCVHWHVKPKSKSGGAEWECDLRTADVQRSGKASCASDAPGPTPAPEPTPAPPAPPPPAPPAPPPLGYKPHLVFFLSDDTGHYNFGFRGNTEARTPNIDALVRDGLLLDRHYVYKYCSPTRSAFLSGRLPIHVNEQNKGIDAAGGVDLRMTMIPEYLRTVGYKSHIVGKWNARSREVESLPIHRGFDSHLGYLGGKCDHYTQQGDVKGAVDLWLDDAPAYGHNGTYGAFMYTNRTVAIIQAHDPSSPLFVYQAWQNTHTPNEVPQEFVDPSIDYPLRRTFEGMAHCLDSGIGNVTAALQAKGMWATTLVAFSSDNGGREDGDFGGNNYPLRGMKFSDFEGGTRVTSFVAGGALPAARRGQVEGGLAHICDWQRTFAFLAGVDPVDHKAAASGLPPTDSLNLWPMLSAGAPSPRLGMALSSAALIQWPYKLVTGKQGGKGVWTGPQHPNATELKTNDDGCPKGCVFDISADPTEHHDLAGDNAELLANLTAALEAAQASKYHTGDVPGYDDCVTSDEFVKAHRGFSGPICKKSA